MADISKYLRPRYTESQASRPPYRIGEVKTPSLSLNGTLTTTTGRLTWSNIDQNTIRYVLYVSYNNGDWKVYNTDLGRTTISLQLSNKLSPGTYKFKIKAFANFNGVDYPSLDSNEVGPFTVVDLSTPTLARATNNTYKLRWNSITGAEYYEFIINDKTIRVNSAPTTANPYIPDVTTEGSYRMYVVAKNSNEFLYHSSQPSNTIIHTTQKLSTPVINTTSTSIPHVYWNSVSNTTSYDLYVNNTRVQQGYTGTDKDFDELLPIGVYNYNVQIKANGSIDEYASPLYLSSEKSEVFSWGTLPEPILTITDNIISISNIDMLENAHHFEIYDNNELIGTREYDPDFSYILTSNEQKYFYIKMKACFEEETEIQINSGLSNAIEYFIRRLNTPTMNTNDGEYYYWNGIAGATYYDVYIDGIKKYTTESDGINIEWEAGYHSIYVIANSNDQQYLPSNKSNVLYNNKNPESEYVTIIDGQQYEYQLPFIFHEKTDETMDDGSITLVPNNIPTPFEAFSEIEIQINDKLQDETILNSKIFYMLISQDDVEEVLIDGASRYIHHINLIERTKLLETEIVPDFSITQPMDYIVKEDPEEGTSDGKVFSSQQWKTLSWTESNLYIPLAWKHNKVVYNFAGLENPSGAPGFINKYILYGSKFFVPYESSNNFILRRGISESQAWNNDYYNVSTMKSHNHLYHSNGYKGIKLQKRYYLSELISDDTYGTKIDITDYIDSNNNLDTKLCPYIEPGKIYKLEYEVFITDEDWNLICSLYNSQNGSEMIKYGLTYGDVDFHIYNGTKPEFMYKDDFSNDADYSTHGFVGINPSVKSDFFNNNLTRYRRTWNFSVVAPGTNVGYDLEANQTFKSIYEVIEKTLELDPFNVKYSFYCPKVEAYLKQKVFTESKFQNCKSLYEVLLEIGRDFYGIPVLGAENADGIYDKNIITFDIRSNEVLELIDSETEEYINTKSTIDNHSTGYISNLSNIISKEEVHIYPSADYWTSPKSSDENEPLANKSNIAIIVDRPIYKIQDIIFKFMYNEDTYTGHLKGYVYEYQHYGALNNDAEGKGLAIFYKMGENIVYGLGFIPQATEIRATCGLSEEDYVINKIIVNILNGNSDMLDYLNDHASAIQYKVIYYPYTDSKVYTEQSNIAGLKNNTYKIMNQENNIISDVKFGKSAQTQISRLGNNSIVITEIHDFYTECPKLDTIKEFDGYKYYADEITYSFNTSYIQADVSYSKNFNKINERVGIDSKYRQYRILNSDYVDRSINKNTYAYISLDEYEDCDDTYLSKTDFSIVKSIYNAYVNLPEQIPSSLYCRFFDKDKNQLKYNAFDGSLKNVDCSTLALSYNIFDNSISLSAEFKDNFSAGVCADKEYFYNGNYTGQYIQQDVRYVDTNGECMYMDFSITDDLTRVVGPNIRSYPKAKFVNNPEYHSLFYSDLLKINKDNGERIKFIYQLHFQTFDKNLTIHSGISKNLFKNHSTYVSSSNMTKDPKYILFKGDISSKSNISEFLNTPVYIEDALEISYDDNIITIEGLTTESLTESYDGFALIEGNGDIIYSYRTNIPSGSTYTIPDIHINFSDSKVSYKER